jgi:hypothetical protein
MNPVLLIDSVIRQTMVLIAQLATSGGARAPLAHLAHQVFVDLSSELEAQGLSRKVTADMFGISLRSYQRKLNRLNESSTDKGRTLWEAVFSYLSQNEVVSRGDVLQRFCRDDGVSVRGILRDLVDSGLVFVTGTGDDAAYRAVRQDEVTEQLARSNDALVWAIVYRSGPLSFAALRDLTHLDDAALLGTLERLVTAERLQCDGAGATASYRAAQFIVERGASLGWEAAVYDHFHAMVATICARLDPDTAREAHRKHIGGSTYSLDIDAEHPLRDRVLGTLERLRTELSDLRSMVNEHNRVHPLKPNGERVVIYTGQCVQLRPETEQA